VRIARELHDGIGQTLTAVAMQAERAAHSPHDAREAALLEIPESIRDSIDDVRRIARELRPEALDDLGLTNALLTLCRRMAHHGGIRIQPELEVSRGMPDLPPETELVIYRVGQEGLTNAIRHADATHITVALQVAEDRITLRVCDDGRGIDRPLPGTPQASAACASERCWSTRNSASTPTPGRAPRSDSMCRSTRNTVPIPLKTKILIADDHAVVRDGLRGVLDAEADLHVVAEAADGADAVARGLQDDIDLAILDIAMPRKTGLQAAQELSRQRPELRILMLTMHDNEQYFFEALKAGASGYVLKAAPNRDLVDRERLGAALRDGKAAVGVLADPDELVAVESILVGLGGETEAHELDAAVLREAAESAGP
jgi:CheY-like chemotaxis protein